jgi:beta-xylosidase
MQMKKDALTSLKICLPKAKAENLMKKKCGKEDIHFSKGSAGTVLISLSSISTSTLLSHAYAVHHGSFLCLNTHRLLSDSVH